MSDTAERFPAVRMGLGIGLVIIGSLTLPSIVIAGGVRRDSLGEVCLDEGNAPLLAGSVLGEWSWFPFGVRCVFGEGAESVVTREPSLLLGIAFFGLLGLWVTGACLVVNAAWVALVRGVRERRLPAMSEDR